MYDASEGRRSEPRQAQEHRQNHVARRCRDTVADSLRRVIVAETDELMRMTVSPADGESWPDGAMVRRGRAVSTIPQPRWQNASAALRAQRYENAVSIERERRKENSERYQAYSAARQPSQ